MQELLFDEYERAWENFDACMVGFRDILLFCKDCKPTQELLVIGNIIERTLGNLNRIDDTNPKPKKQENWHLDLRDCSKHELVTIIENIYIDKKLDKDYMEKLVYGRKSL